MTKVEVDRIERNARRYLSNTVGVEREHASCVKDILALTENDQAQRVVIASFEELAKMNGAEITKLVTENKTLRGTCALRYQEIERLTMQVGTLREALQTCQSRLGCGCGDILCTTCSAAYDVADQALKEVS